MATPVKATPVKEAPADTDSPGTWRHPRLDEITRRRSRTTFTEKNVRRIIYNVGYLLSLWSLRLVARMIVTWKLQYASWAWFLVQLVPVFNIAIACLPLLRRQDDLSDIPLTATQRKLLNLPPSSAAPTPDAKYSTPPRYSRTPSIAGSIGSRASYNSSPLSGRGGSPIAQREGGSPYSPAGSPFQKSLSGLANGRRSSFGSGSPIGSPLGATSSAKLFPDPGSPSPSGAKRASVGLNNKWLYERGRRSSGSAWVH